MSKGIISILIVLLVLSLGIFYFWWQFVGLPVNSRNQETTIFVIPQGWGSSQIAQELKKEGLIRNELAFRILAYKNGINKQLQAGDFRLSPSMNLAEIAEALTHGTLDVWVTIPEGLRREEISQRIRDAFAKQNTVFDESALLEVTSGKEGFLFPDTYLIPKQASVSAIAKMLTKNFEEKFTQLTVPTGWTEKEIVILASILEREAKMQSDKQVIAGIIRKRLKNDWPLQVDASIQYAKANITCNASTGNLETCNWWPKITSQDLTLSSPYNTYENTGLPPAPICNPGLVSLKAAVNPKDSPYYYYLSDNDGTLHWAVTNEEQEENIKKFLN